MVYLVLILAFFQELRYCKVALAALHTELTLYILHTELADTLQWTRLHPDYLRHIKVSRCDAYLELCTGNMCMQIGLKACPNQLLCQARSKMASIKHDKAHWVGVSPDSFIVSKYLTI